MKHVEGADKVEKMLRSLGDKEAVELVGTALFTGGDIIKAEAGRLITEHSSAGSSGGKHQHIPSLPGQPPNEFSGHLRRNIETLRVAPLVVEVRSSAPYAAALEFGRVGAAARPYMGPAARAKRKEVVALVEKAVAVAVRRAKK